MGKRVFSDERINEILESIDFGRLSRGVYSYVHEERIEDDFELEFFMFDRRLTIELWRWDVNRREWLTVADYLIADIDGLSYKLERGVRRCLERAMY